MKRRKLFIILMMGIMILSLAACSASVDDSKPTLNPAGNYTMTAMTSEGVPMTEEELAALNAAGLTVTMVLNEDNTGTIKLFGQELAITWDAEKIIMDGGSPANYTYDGNTLVMQDESSDSELTFTKD